MCYILAKYLHKQGFEVVLEKNTGKNQWCDLVVNNTNIETKFYYEPDLRRRLEKEMKRNDWNIDKLLAKLDSLKEVNKSYGWSMALTTIEDMLNKSPDLFILIILSRDLSKTNAPLEQICWSKYEKGI
jgi:hypothetical protein